MSKRGKSNRVSNRRTPPPAGAPGGAGQEPDPSPQNKQLGGDSAGQSWRNPARRAWIAGLAAIAAIVAAGAYGYWRSRPDRSNRDSKVAGDEIKEAFLPTRLENPGYVGAQACAECHAARFHDFSQTNHFRACQRPGPGIMAPGFESGKGTFLTHDPKLRFEMTKVGDQYLQTTVRKTPQGEERSTLPISLVYGVGELDQVYFTWLRGAISELPTAWLFPLDTWGHTSINPHGSKNFERVTTPRCLECHNTWIEHVPGSTNEYRDEGAILGISCERCHGPGKDHIAFHRENPKESRGQAIVQPARLTRDRQVEICSQCHGNAPKSRREAFAYRPGEPLEEFVKWLESKTPEEEHVANQTKYMKESKCYQASETMTCVTCHDPHTPTDVKAVRGACLKCHQPADCGERERLPEAARDDCSACHLPQRTWMTVHFHTTDDEFVPPIRRFRHRIGVYPEATKETLLAYYRDQPDEASQAESKRLKGELTEFWIAEGDRYLGDFRHLAAIGAYREAIRVEPNESAQRKLAGAIDLQRQIHSGTMEAMYRIEQRDYDGAIATLQGVLKIKPDHAVAHGKLGTLYANANNFPLARKHLTAVAEHDPNDPYGYNMLGWLAYLQDQPEQAVAAFRKADEIYPFDVHINFRLGLGLAKMGDFKAAADAFRKTLEIDPNHAGACQGLSQALVQQKEPREAVSFALRAVRLSESKSPDILATLAEAYSAMGMSWKAEDTAAKALALAEKTDRKSAPALRRRLGRRAPP